MKKTNPINVLTIIKFLVPIFWVSLFIVVFFSSFEEQVAINNKLKNKTVWFFPQGWSFFTKSPLDEISQTFFYNGQNWVEIDITTHSFDSYLGFSRKPRYRAYECAQILVHIPDSSYTSVKRKDISFKKIYSTVEVTKDDKFKNLLSGKYFIIKYRPVPYVWHSYNQERNVVCEVVNVYLK